MPAQAADVVEIRFDFLWIDQHGTQLEAFDQVEGGGDFGSRVRFEEGDSFAFEQRLQRPFASRLHLLANASRQIDLCGGALAAQHLFDELDLTSQASRITRSIAAAATPALKDWRPIIACAAARGLTTAGGQHKTEPRIAQKRIVRPQPYAARRPGDDIDRPGNEQRSGEASFDQFPKWAKMWVEHVGCANLAGIGFRRIVDGGMHSEVVKRSDQARRNHGRPQVIAGDSLRNARIDGGDLAILDDDHAGPKLAVVAEQTTGF